MSDLSHLRLENTASRLPYTSTGGGRGEFALPQRNRSTHAGQLIGQIEQVRTQVEAARQQRPPANNEIDGLPLTLRSEPGFDLKLESLDRQRDGMELLSVRRDDNTSVANVFVRRDKLVNFIRLIEQYRDRDTLTRKPKNQKLVDSIADIRLVAVRDLWQEAGRQPFPDPDQNIWWEVWIRMGGLDARTAYSHFAELALRNQIRVSEDSVVFPERVVLLAWATARQLGASVDLLAYIAELRRAKQVPTHYLDLPPRDQQILVDEVVQRLVRPAADAPAVCLLDTGVNRQHPLIEPALAAVDTQAVDPAWGVADHDADQHGTAMAGIALYECLTDVLNSNGTIQLRHCLESVKLLPPPPGANDPKVYGAVTQQAVAKAGIQAPDRNRAICMAITADDLDQGLPSSWSAAVDQMCAGELDDIRKLMFISAGNYSAVLVNPEYSYPDWNLRFAGIQDPAQAWNAIAVGAYTEKVVIRDPTLRGWQPIAPTGDLTPTSRTSRAWPTENHGWPIKPDIVMEGGNYITDGTNRDWCSDLSLLTTILHPTGRLFTDMRDSSAATAAAARLAAIIWSHYPRLWPETIRGLLIHSAKWTQAMLDRCPGTKKEDVQDRLRCFGYGVPNVRRATWSAENAATLIFEGELQPFDKVGSEYKTKEMHLHHIPWPTDLLQQLGEVPVTMHVTLSYFVEPSPGRKGWGEKHRFQSHGLRFDVISPLEDEDQFKRRVSRAMWDNDQRPDNIPETRNWTVGSRNRTRGSVHSDWWTGTAAELARCGTLAVYPVTGWWRERHHLGRWDRKARYSLIISIETPAVDVDLYAQIVNQAMVTAELEL